MTSRKKRLAKDLDFLIGAASRPVDASSAGADSATATSSAASDDGLRLLPIEQLQRGQFQPRREFDETALAELAASIAREGVMQPIVVRPVAEQRWEIIAGERRWRACQRAGLDRIPAIVRMVSDESAIAMALIENIQRENLNAVEEGLALQRLQTEFELSQQQVADRVGKSRSAIANLLRLLSLESEVKALLETRQLDAGHAKVLLALSGKKQIYAAKQVVSEHLSVRETEKLVKSLLAEASSDRDPKPIVDPNITKLERDLSGTLGASVSITHSKSGKGKLVINYTSLDELDGILQHIH